MTAYRAKPDPIQRFDKTVSVSSGTNFRHLDESRQRMDLEPLQTGFRHIDGWNCCSHAT